MAVAGAREKRDRTGGASGSAVAVQSSKQRCKDVADIMDILKLNKPVRSHIL